MGIIIIHDLFVEFEFFSSAILNLRYDFLILGVIFTFWKFLPGYH